MKKKDQTIKTCAGIKPDKLRSGISELVFILDRSGSMAGLEEDTVGGFNSMIEKQKENDGLCYVSTVLFNGSSEVLHDRIPLSEIPKMTAGDYIAYGSTALIDAIGDAIKHIANIHKYARPEDVPDQTMFIITTDGEENASHRYNSSEVKKMIEQKKKQGWEFLFIGANIDAVETARHYGIRPDRAVNYNSDKEGTRVVYHSVSKLIKDYVECEQITPEWSAEIDEDYRRRSMKNNKQ